MKLLIVKKMKTKFVLREKKNSSRNQPPDTLMRLYRAKFSEIRAFSGRNKEGKFI